MEASTEIPLLEVVSVCSSDDCTDVAFPTPSQTDDKYVETGESTQVKMLRAENRWVRESRREQIDHLQSLLCEERQEAADHIQSLREEIDGWQKKYQDLEIDNCHLEENLEAEKTKRAKTTFVEGTLRDEIERSQKSYQDLQTENQDQRKGLENSQREQSAVILKNHSLRADIEGWQKKYEDLEAERLHQKELREAGIVRLADAFEEQKTLRDYTKAMDKRNLESRAEICDLKKQLVAHQAEQSKETTENQKLQAEIKVWQKKYEDLEAEKACSEKTLETEINQIKAEFEGRTRHKQHCVRQLPDLVNMEIADPNSFAEQCKFYVLQRHEFESGLHKEAVVRLLEHLDIDQMREILRGNLKKIQEVSELRPLTSALWLSAAF